MVLLNWAGSSAWAQSRFDDAKRYAEEAIALADDPDFDSLVWSFVDLAFVASSEGHVDQAIETLRIGSEHPSDRHDRYCLAVLLYFLAVSDRNHEAIGVADDIVRRVDASGVPCSIVIAYAGKGAALEATDTGQSLPAYEHALAVAYSSGNRFLENLVAPRLAMLQARNGDHVAALRGLRRLLESWGAAVDVVVVSSLRVGLIVVLARLGLNEAAATLNGTLTTANEAIAFVSEITDVVSQVRGALGDATFANATRRGAAMASHEANSYALGQIRQALASLGVADAPTHSA